VVPILTQMLAEQTTDVCTFGLADWILALGAADSDGYKYLSQKNSVPLLKADLTLHFSRV